jgi:hypothetical protein
MRVIMALQIAATAICNELALIGATARDISQRLVAAIVVRAQPVLDPYRPEMHYMRGPGPKWREKHGVTARQ